MDKEELERLAQQELLQEAKRAKVRADEMGPVGWQRCPLPSTNKRFLHNVVVSTLEPKRKKSKQNGAEQKKDNESMELKQETNEPLNSHSKHHKRKSKHKHKDKSRDKGSSKHKSSHKSKHKKRIE